MDGKELLNDWLLDIGAEGGDLVKRLGPDQRKAMVDVLTDIAQLRVKEVASGVAAIAGETALAESSLKDLRSVVASEVSRTVNNVLQNSAKMAGSILKGLLGGILG